MARNRGYLQDDARDDEMTRDLERDDVERPQNTMPSYDITDDEEDDVDGGIEGSPRYDDDFYDDYDDYDPVG